MTAMTTVNAVMVATAAVVVTPLGPRRPSRGGLAVRHSQRDRSRRGRRRRRAMRQSGSLRPAAREGHHRHTHQHDDAARQRAPTQSRL